MSRRSLIFIFLIFFGVKLSVSIYYTTSLFCRNPEIRAGCLTAFTGDSFSYTGAMENYINNGEYYFEFNDKKIYAGRVPHYSIPYYMFRQFFNKNTALDLLILSQLLLEAIAFFIVSLILLKITRSRLIFFISLLFSAASFYYTYPSLTPITDSPASSLLLISFWFLFRYLSSTTPNTRNWIFFCVLLSLATIFRPYFGLIFIFVLAFLLIRYKLTISTIFKRSAVYGIALLLFLSPWIIRNYSR